MTAAHMTLEQCKHNAGLIWIRYMKQALLLGERCLAAEHVAGAHETNLYRRRLCSPVGLCEGDSERTGDAITVHIRNVIVNLE